MTTFQEGGEERLIRICVEYAINLETAIDTGEVERAAEISANFASELASSVFEEKGAEAAVDTLRAVLFEAELVQALENVNGNEEDVLDALDKADSEEVTSVLIGHTGFFARLWRKICRLLGR